MNYSAAPQWRELLERQLALHEHLPFSRFVQAATIRSDGRPANRTVTFRFFASENRLLFTADTRSEKIVQLAANPWAELCWYFTESRMQFRLLGRMQLSDAGKSSDEMLQARDRTWNERSSASRQSFTWPPAGRPLAEPAAFERTVPPLPPDTFGLLIFTPEQVDVLELTQQPHARTIHVTDHGKWNSAAVNP